jgi:hypothetical protein
MLCGHIHFPECFVFNICNFGSSLKVRNHVTPVIESWQSSSFTICFESTGGDDSF